MSLRRLYSRRAFIGLAAAAAAVVAAVKAAGSGGAVPVNTGPAHTGPGNPARRVAQHRPVSENMLPCDPHWNITHIGRPEEIMGYAGQYSVLAGQPVTLYVSTTARSFTVSAFRMGWYRGDQARLVWKSATVPGRR